MNPSNKKIFKYFKSIVREVRTMIGQIRVFLPEVCGLSYKGRQTTLNVLNYVYTKTTVSQSEDMSVFRLSLRRD